MNIDGLNKTGMVTNGHGQYRYENKRTRTVGMLSMQGFTACE